MKKTIILLLCVLASISLATTPAWTTPSKVGVSAFAVNDYTNYYVSLNSLSRCIYHKNTFIDSLFAELTENYPGKTKYVAYNYEDSLASFVNYKSAFTYHSEFLFFSGHGNQQTICLSDHPMTVSEGCVGDNCYMYAWGKVYGGDTRWVIFDACLVLNVNKYNKKHLPISVDNVDLNKVDALRTAFYGVHAMLGFYSLSWEYAFWSNGQLHGSENLYKYFSTYFIEDGETIWDSFDMANASLYNEFDTYYLATFNEHILGLKPAVAFLRGYDSNGYYHDTSAERFDYTFNQPIQITGTLELFVMYDEYGTPEFY
ncbi:MAG: hypothetical protein SPL52_00420 [Fibrobacter sp.]|nr:hypothetical protein [Fibrobacter sp.]